MSNNIAAMVEIGQQIVTLGNKLEELKAKRDALDAEINVIQKDLTPLVIRHTEIVASLTGTPATPPPAPRPTRSKKDDDATGLERRIHMLMEKTQEDELSAVQIAEFLGEDAFKVREMMRRMYERKREALAAAPELEKA